MTQFGDYTLSEPLGAGDMGTVYRASHPSHSDPIVVKVLDKVDTSNPMQRGSAVELLDFAATLTHARLLPVLEIVEIGDEEGEGQLGLVMPYMGGRSLGDVLGKGAKIPGKQSLKMVAQLASGLQALHDQEVAHGSVKPSNILLDAEGNASLTDLSMAHLRELGLVPAKPTRQHLLFMAPEREYHAAPEIIGDVFSLGVVTYLLLAGNMPWAEIDPEARGGVPAGNLPPALVAVLRRELNPQVRFRYQNLTEFMNALKAAVQGQVDPETERLFGVNAPPPPPPPEPGKG